MKLPCRKKIRRAASLLAIGLYGTSNVHAGLLASDSFESYTAASNIHGQSGGTGWGGAWSVQNISGGPSGSATVSNTSITYNYGGVTFGGGKSLQLDTNSNGTQRDVFSSVNTGGSDYYVSMIFQFSGTVFTGWQAKDGSVDITNDSIGLVNTNGTVGARVDNGTASSAAGLVAAGTTYFMVIEYTGWTGSSYSTVNLWINPNTGGQSNSTVSATYTDTTPVDGDGSAGFLGLYVRAASFSTGATFLIDDLRVGTDWASVTSTIPEPSSIPFITAGLAGCVVLTSRRSRRG